MREELNKYLSANFPRLPVDHVDRAVRKSPFPLSSLTVVTIITVHLATAIGGTCGVGCGEYFVVGLYWLSRRISQTTPSAQSVKHAADPRIDHQVRSHIPPWKRGIGHCTRYGPPCAPPPYRRGAPRHRHLHSSLVPLRLFTSSFFRRKLPRICPHRRKLRLHLS